jgi:hypothetical protein
MVVQAYNPNTWEAKAGGSRVRSQLGLHSKTMSQRNKNGENGKSILGSICYPEHAQRHGVCNLTKSHPHPEHKMRRADYATENGQQPQKCAQFPSSGKHGAYCDTNTTNTTAKTERQITQCWQG